MIVEIIDSILSKTGQGVSANDAFIKTFQELGVLGGIQYNYEQKMGKYCTPTDEFYRFLVLNNEYDGLHFGPQEEEHGVFFFNEEKGWKDYMFLVKLINPYREHLKEQERREWANKIWTMSKNANLPSHCKKCKVNWEIDYFNYPKNGRINILIGFNNYSWAPDADVDPFMLYIDKNEEHEEVAKYLAKYFDEYSLEEDIFLIEDINIVKNTVSLRIGARYFDFELFNEYQLANWTDAQLAEDIVVLKNLIDAKPF
jgi:hypothetical protein